MGNVDDALLADPAPAGEEGAPTINELLAQVRDEIHSLPERLAAVLAPEPAAGLPEVDGR